MRIKVQSLARCVWQCTPVVPALGRQRKEYQTLGQIGLYRARAVTQDINGTRASSDAAEGCELGCPASAFGETIELLIGLAIQWQQPCGFDHRDHCLVLSLQTSSLPFCQRTDVILHLSLTGINTGNIKALSNEKLETITFKT